MAILNPAWQMERKISLYIPEGKRNKVLIAGLMRTSIARRTLGKNVIVA